MSQQIRRQLTLAVMVAACAGVVVHLLWAETPRGRVTGTLIASETGAALAGVKVSLVGRSEGTPTYRAKTDDRGRFGFGHVRAGEYVLVPDTQAHKQPTDKITVREGRTTGVVFELQPTEPFLSLYAPQAVFTTGEQPRLRAHGFLPANELGVQVCRVNTDVALARWNGWLSPGLTTQGRKLENVPLEAVPELTTVLRRSVPITGRDVEGVFNQDLRLDALPPGMYVVAVEATGRRYMTVLTITDLGLIVKASPRDLLVQAVGITDGTGLAGASVEVLRDGKAVAKGTTDRDGLLTASLPADTSSGELQVVGRLGESLAVADLYYYWGEEDGAYRVYCYTERPVYRPGQKVYFKSLVRAVRGDGYLVPDPLALRVRAVDEQGNVVYQGEATTNRFGSVNGQFDLSESALPGSYLLTVFCGGAPYESRFEVAEYRKPEFEVKVATPRDRYVAGETIEASVEAEYYYGAPVAGAKVEYLVTRSPAWYYPEADQWDEDLYEPEDYEAEGEVVAQGEGRTDDAGRLTVTVPAKVAATQVGYGQQDQDFVIHAEVRDPSDRSETATHSVLVTQGEYRLEVSLDDWVCEPGQEVAVRLRAVDYEGRPVAGARGELVLALSEGAEERERLQEEARVKWRADSDGQAAVTVKPVRAGDHRVLAKSTDARGNVITASEWLWAMQGAYASFDYPYQDLDVQADRELYRVGDEAQIIVNTRHAPITALLTVEGATVLQRRLVRLEGKSTILSLKVGPEFMPCVYASVCFVKDKELFSGTTLVNVSREKKALVVQVTSDKATYLPGEKAVYSVKTTTSEGGPVQAEVSLGVVDEAVYAIRRDTVPDILQHFYPKRPPLVDTAFSFPTVYLSAEDKAGARIQTRRVFRDTAFWAPATVTDASGQASIECTMPDNLTTWRATCRAATLDTRVGQATYKAVVRKPFLVRLEAPRFFTLGDSVQIAALVHNLTDQAVTARVGLEAGGLDLAGQAQSTCAVAAGQIARVEWQVQASAVGDSRVRVWADAGSLSDAMELTLPVLPKGRERRDVRAGSVASREDLRFEVRKDCVAGTQRLTLRLTPSLAAGMLGALEYLAHYPYGCTEQTTSAFLPDVIILQMLGKLGMDNPGLRARLPKMVEAGLLKLYDLQHSDGGWGWWKYDDSAPWMTAYAAFGLLQARAAGFPVNERVLGDGLEALANLARAPEKASHDARVYAAYVLTVAGRSAEAGRLLAPYLADRGRAGLTDWGRAFLAVDLARVGQGDEGRRLLESVWQRFTQGALAGGSGPDWWSDTESAAVLLSAACELMPDDPRLPDLVRWILERREGDYWYSTRATAFTLYALSDYLLITRELKPDLRVNVSVNGRVVASRAFTEADVFRPEVEVELDASALGTGPVAVTIEKSGAGRLYYSAALTQVADVDLKVPVGGSAGLVVERAYRVLPSRGRAGEGEPPARAGGSSVTFAGGDLVEVTLTLRATRDLDHLMVEDPLPAGCEASDRGRVEPWDWDYWWSDQVVRDEKVAFAIEHLEAGAQRLKYQIHAQTAGQYTALPPQAYDMYNPTVRADGVAHTVTVRR